MPDRTIAPEIHDAIEFDYKLPPIHEEKLDNHIPVYWLDAGTQDVVQVDWVFPAGLWYEQKPSVAQATATLLKNGTSRYSAGQISEALEFYGAQLKTAASNDYATVTLFSMVRHLPALLPMVYEILTDATFPEAEVEIYKSNTVQKLLVSLRQCEFVANQQIDALLYGEAHPYGRYSRKENIEALQPADLQAFYKANFCLGSAKVFMAGKICKAEVKLINDVFGKTGAVISTAVKPGFQIHTAAGRIHHIDNDPNAVQGAIRIGRLFPNRHHPDYSPMVVLNTLFGGYFGSRLMSNIREDKGYTYGIYSSLAPEVSGGSLVVQTEVGRDLVEHAVKEIYNEMEMLCNEEAPEEELLLVKNYLLGGLLADLDGPFSILQRWRMLILNGFTESYFNNNIRIYKTITASELKSLAQKYFVADQFLQITVV